MKRKSIFLSLLCACLFITMSTSSVFGWRIPDLNANISTLQAPVSPGSGDSGETGETTGNSLDSSTSSSTETSESASSESEAELIGATSEAGNTRDEGESLESPDAGISIDDLNSKLEGSGVVLVPMDPIDTNVLANGGREDDIKEETKKDDSKKYVTEKDVVKDNAVKEDLTKDDAENVAKDVTKDDAKDSAKAEKVTGSEAKNFTSHEKQNLANTKTNNVQKIDSVENEEKPNTGDSDDFYDSMLLGAGSLGMLILTLAKRKKIMQ